MKESAVRAWRNLPARERLRCIVVEHGASRFRRPQGDGFDETVAIAQMPGELPAVFLQRAMARIASTERSGRHFESITLLTGDDQGDGAQAARRLLVLGLSAHARAHAEQVEMVLQASPQTEQRSRNELLELVGEVTESGGSLNVRLCFGEPVATPAPPRSGVFLKPLRGRA